MAFLELKHQEIQPLQDCSEFPLLASLSFQLLLELNGFLWMPDDGLVPRLVGPAIISFTKDGGYSFPILADAFHLPFDLLTKLGILKFDEDSSDGHTAAVDLTKVYSVKYDSLGEAGLFDNSHHYD